MKLIKLNEASKEKALTAFQAYLDTLKLGLNETAAKFDMQALLKASAKSPQICITTDAWEKMEHLTNSSNLELAWHGYVERHGNKFLIYDIFMYPQKVASATVNTDDDAYATWITEQNPVKMCKMRLQGHSHVNMSTSPSIVDTTYYDTILKMLPDDDFYIFCISSKTHAYNWFIYDLKENILFENADIEVSIVNQKGVSYAAWAEAQKEKYQTIEKPISYVGTQSGYGYGSGAYHQNFVPGYKWPSNVDDKKICIICTTYLGNKKTCPKCHTKVKV